MNSRTILALVIAAAAAVWYFFLRGGSGGGGGNGQVSAAIGSDPGAVPGGTTVNLGGIESGLGQAMDGLFGGVDGGLFDTPPTSAAPGGISGSNAPAGGSAFTPSPTNTAGSVLNALFPSGSSLPTGNLVGPTHAPLPTASAPSQALGSSVPAQSQTNIANRQQNNSIGALQRARQLA